MGGEVPHEFWFAEPVARDLGCCDLPAVLARIAALPGWSQGRLAEMLGYSRPTVSKIIGRSRPLQVDEARRIVATLGIPSFLIGLDDDKPFEMARAPDLTDNYQRTRVTLSNLRETTAKFAAMERRFGGNSLTAPLARQVSLAVPFVRERPAPRNLSAFSELAALAGYAFYDAQRHRRSDYFYSIALEAAYEGGNSALVGQVRSLMSMKATWQDRTNEGAAHCLAALDSGLSMPAIVKAMLIGRRARAEALRGERLLVHRLLDSSAKLLPESPSMPNSPIAYWSEMEVRGNAGIAFKDLGEFDLAEENLLHAIRAGDRESSRDSVLYLGMLSRLYIKQDRREEAVDAVRGILDRKLASSRAKTQLRLFIVKSTHWREPFMRDVRPQIRLAISVV